MEISYKFYVWVYILLIALCLPLTRCACLFNQYLDSNSVCQYCYTAFPGCNTCTSSICTSCSEGLYFVVDQSLCVESCAIVVIPSTNTDQSPYFADDFARQCIKCGTDCGNCINNYGCTNILKDSSSSDATSYLATITNSKLQSTLCSNLFASCKLCTSSACTLCSAKLLSSGSCSTACSNTNCRYCNADKTVCTLCANGYVLSSGSCVAKTCAVSNCNDCISSSATTCTTCKEGYLNGGTTCTACISNCLQCSSSTTCNLCQPGYILASDGNSCVSSCSSGQFIQVTKLASPYGSAVDNRKCVACDSSCERCINNNAAISCTRCSLGKFLTVTDSTQISGTCVAKTTYSSTSDFVIYVSNSDTDYAKASSSILGTQANPDIDLMTAIKRAKQMVAPYTTKSDGSNLRVNIVLYKGDHYLLRKNIIPFLSYKDFYSYNYEIKITPMYCTTFPTDTTHCYTTGTDQVNIYSKLGPELDITIPKVLTFENILFQLIDGFIPSQNDLDSCLTTRKKCCVWSTSTSTIVQVSTSQIETCTFRIGLSESCHRASKYNMMNFAPYSAKYGLTAPPQLVLTSVTFADIFFEMNSLVDFNVGGLVTVTGSSFLRFSNCGSVFKNSNTPMINFKITPYYLTYVDHFNLRKNTVTSEYSCTGSTECFNVLISSSTFSTFNYLKTVAVYGSFTNADNYIQNHAYILQLESFSGQVVLNGNTFTDIVSTVGSCGVWCYESIFGNPQQINIYGTEEDLVFNYLIYLPSHDRDFQVIGNTFTSCTPTSSLINIVQTSATPSSIIMFYMNTFTMSGTFGYGNGVIFVNRYVDTSFESADVTTITNLLKTSTRAPCSGTSFVSNTINKVATCTDSGVQILFQCLRTGGSIFFPSLSQDAMVSISGTNTNTYPYTVTYNSASMTLDLNYFNFNSNSISNFLGAIGMQMMEISGFMNLNIKSNSFQNSGRYIEASVVTWTQVSKYSIPLDSFPVTNSCTNSSSDDTTGFMLISNSNLVNVLSNTINNLFFTYGVDNFVSPYGSFLTISNVAGPFTITTLTVTGQIGILGDYNINTIGTLSASSYLTSFSNNMLSYQFVPLITTDQTNKIPVMKITSVTFDNSIGSLSSSGQGGLFLHFIQQSATGYIDITSLQIDLFTSNNCYIYGVGGLIYREGPMIITNSKAIGYGSTTPSTTATTVSQGAVYYNVIRPSHYSKFQSITMQNNFSGKYGATICILSDINMDAAALTTNNFEIISPMITGCGSLNSVMYLSATSLIGQIDDLNLVSTSSSGDGSLFISGGTITFNRPIFTNNNGVTASDINVNTCTSCNILFSSGTFTRVAVDTTTSPLVWNKASSVYLLEGGTVTFKSCSFNNYLLVSLGGVIEMYSSNLVLQSCTFSQNSANYGGVIYAHTDSTITMTSSTFTNNKANTQAGIVYSVGNVAVSIQTCTFTSNSAPIDGIFTGIQFCSINDVGSTFSGNTASTQNSLGSQFQGSGSTFSGSKFLQNSVTGGIGILIFNMEGAITLNNVQVIDNTISRGYKNFFFLSSTVNAQSTTFKTNSPITDSSDTSQGGFVNMLDCIATFQSNSFTNGRAGQGGASTISLNKNNGFTQTSASQIRDGSAVSIDTTVIFSATSNTFKNLVSGNGAVSLIDNESSVDLSILFPSLTSSSTKLVTFSSNTFTGCKSYGTVGGGAVYYACTLSGCQLSFSGDNFISCTSTVNGGAILWTYSQPNGVDTCIFSNNIATIYGNNVAAIPTKIMVMPGTSYSNMIISNQRSGGSLPLLKIGVYDVYGQIVASLNDGTLTSTITWNTKDTYPSFVTEPDTLKSTSGIFSFNNVVTTGTPGVTQKITFKTSSINEKIPVNKAYLTSNSLSSSGITFTVNLRYCIAGEEFLSDGACSTCATGVGYSMVAPTTISSCTPCPVNYAYCLGGNSIAPKAGYWRPDISSDLFLQCQTTSACLGYTSANNNFYGACSEGYIGVLCGDCDYGYSRTNDFECGKCPNTIYNGLRISGFILLMITVLLFLVKTTLNGAGNKRNALGVYNRIIVNHVQMVTIIYSFKLEWPSTFTDIFKSTKTASDVTQQFISFDCFIDRRTSTDMNANPIPLFYYRLFLMAALPLIIMIINSIIWNIIFLYYTYKETPESRLNTANYRKMLGNQKERRIIATNFIVLLFIHPSILNVYFQMFSCTKINGVSRLNQELATECYTGLHLYLSLFVASPAILIWGFGIPLYAIGKLYFSRKVLERDETREEIGYLYNGYSELSYYWEPVIIIRKIVLVACASLFTSLGRKVQAMLIFIFLLFVILLQSHK